MKILVITNNYPRNPSDNFGWFVHELNKEIRNNGFKVFVLAPGCESCHKTEIIDGIQIYRFNYFYPRQFEQLAYGYGILQNIKKNFKLIFQLPFFFFLGFISLVRVISQEKPDIIHAHWLIPSGFFGLIGKNIFHIPLIITVHGTDIRNLPHYLRCQLLRSANAIISPHPELSRIIQKCKFIPFFVPNLIKENSYSQFNNIHNYPQLKNKNVVSFIGRLDRFKDPLTFIHSIPLILNHRKDIIFLIVGDGNLKDDMLQLIENYKISQNVAYMGYMDNVHDILKYTSIFVSLSPIENIWSLALVEAMMHSIPCIVTNSGTSSEIIHDNVNGCLIPSRDPTSLAEKILFLFDNETLRELIGRNGFQLVKDIFNNQKNVQKIISIYQNVLQKEV